MTPEFYPDVQVGRDATGRAIYAKDLLPQKVYCLFSVGYDDDRRTLIKVFATKAAMESYVERASTWSDKPLFKKYDGPPGAYEWDEEEVQP